MANLTRHINIRQKVHLNLDNTITRAGFTTATLDIERETPLLITSDLGLIGFGKKITNIVKNACISRYFAGIFLIRIFYSLQNTDTLDLIRDHVDTNIYMINYRLDRKSTRLNSSH